MNRLRFLSAALTVLFLMVTAQSAFALNCPARQGDPFGNTASEYFLNAVNDTCGGAAFPADPSNDGHIVVGGDDHVIIQFIEDGALFSPTSKSLTCTGSSSTQVFATSMSAQFSAPGFLTTCSVSYTTPTGLLVTHSFNTTSVLQSGFYIGSTSAFSATTGWFERVPPSIVLSGLSSNIGSAGQVVTATFSEDVTGFALGDLSLTNLTASNFVVRDAATYEFLLTPVAAGAVSVSVPATTTVDLAGNDNTVSNTLSGSADLDSPSVVITGLPGSFVGPTVFDATITFNENVTGFTVADITISGGVVTALAGSGAIYTATVSTTGGVDLVMSIGADVAADVAGNGNLASGTVTATDIITTQTSEVIAQFMQGRANALLGNQPDLAGFLRGGDRFFGADVTRGEGGLNLSTGHNAPVWARLNVNWSTNSGAESATTFGAVGGHADLSDNLLLGGMFQFDNQRETNGAAFIKGTGWLAGPYFVAKVPDQKLYFEGSFLYGQTHNDISPLGTYSDSFTSERWLATLGVSGEVLKDKITLIPFLDAKYTSDTQAAYVDSLGSTIPKQSVEMWQVSSGLDFLVPLSAQTTLNGGVSGVWSMNEGTGAAASVVPGFDGGRARVNLGVSHRFSATNLLALSGYYDGIGTSDFEGYSVELMWNAQF